MRTRLQVIYDTFDVLIDLCDEANLRDRARILRNMRDKLP